MNSNSPALYVGGAFGQAQAAIMRSLMRRDPLILVTGQNGTGKTTLCRSAVESVGAAASTIVAPCPTFHRVLEQIAADFHIAWNPLSEHDLIRSIQQFIESNLIASHPDRLAVVVIDDAHLMSPTVLGELQVLLGFSTKDQGLTILLVGQPELENVLRRPECRSVGQAVVQKWRLAPLTKAAVPDYLARRYSEVNVWLTADALDRMTEISRGVPALLDRLFEAAAAVASTRRVAQIDSTIVREAAAGLESLPPARARGRAARRIVVAAAVLVALGWITSQGWKRAFPAVPTAPAARRASEPQAPPVPSAAPSTSPAVAQADAPQSAPAPAPTEDQTARDPGQRQQSVRDAPRRADDTAATQALLRQKVSGVRGPSARKGVERRTIETSIVTASTRHTMQVDEFLKLPQPTIPAGFDVQNNRIPASPSDNGFAEGDIVTLTVDGHFKPRRSRRVKPPVPVVVSRVSGRSPLSEGQARAESASRPLAPPRGVGAKRRALTPRSARRESGSNGGRPRYKMLGSTRVQNYAL